LSEEQYVTEDSESSKGGSESGAQSPPSQAVLKSRPLTIDRPLRLSIAAPVAEQNVSSRRHHKIKLEPHALWYAIDRPPVNVETDRPTNPEVINHLHSRGKFLLQLESDNYQSSDHVTASDRQFLSTIMTSGTQSDKLSALTLFITSSPLHCQKQLDTLLGMATKKSRNDAVQAVAALKDLLLGNLLPERKLYYFAKQAGLTASAKDEELVLWTFEDWLKGWYFRVLQVIEVSSQVSSDTDSGSIYGSAPLCQESYDFLCF